MFSNWSYKIAACFEIIIIILMLCIFLLVRWYCVSEAFAAINVMGSLNVCVSLQTVLQIWITILKMTTIVTHQSRRRAMTLFKARSGGASMFLSLFEESPTFLKRGEIST